MKKAYRQLEQVMMAAQRLAAERRARLQLPMLVA
jgi:hypothetical protein